MVWAIFSSFRVISGLLLREIRFLSSSNCSTNLLMRLNILHMGKLWMFYTLLRTALGNLNYFDH